MPVADERNEQFEYWMLELLSRQLELLAVVAVAANETQARAVLRRHAADELQWSHGWRPADDVPEQ